MPSKRLVSRLFLVGGLILLVLIFIFRDKVSLLWQFNIDKAKVVVSNFGPNLEQSDYRRPPLSNLLKETKLGMYFGEPFKSFDASEWKSFWEIIYAEYPKDNVGEGLPLRNRQLTQDEIVQELLNRYGEPFNRYQSAHWQFFFELLTKK